MTPVAKIPAQKLFAPLGSGYRKVQSSTARSAQSCPEMPIATCSPRENRVRSSWLARRRPANERAVAENLTCGNSSSMPRIVTEAASRTAMSPNTNSSPGLLGARKTTRSRQACSVMPSSSGPRTSGARSV